MTDTAPEATIDNETAPPEPDYRFLLANERTFLAYLRTALAFDGGALAVHGLTDVDAVTRTLLSTVCAVVGIVLAISAFTRWRAADQAIRRAGALPAPAGFRPVSVILAIASIAILALAAFA